MDDSSKVTAALLQALGVRDANTGAHSSRTCLLSLELGRACALSSTDLERLHLAAQLHDIGKIGIPDRVLLKPGKLDADELDVMRSHPRRGYEILASVPDASLAAIADVVLHHHEGYDGNGYPDRLSGEAIPYLSRLVSIADSYDAIATVRPYHKPRSHDDIMQVLFEQHAGKYDPYIRGVFAKVIERSPHRAAPVT